MLELSPTQTQLILKPKFRDGVFNSDFKTISLSFYNM